MFADHCHPHQHRSPSLHWNTKPPPSPKLPQYPIPKPAATACSIRGAVLSSKAEREVSSVPEAQRTYIAIDLNNAEEKEMPI